MKLWSEFGGPTRNLILVSIAGSGSDEFQKHEFLKSLLEIVWVPIRGYLNIALISNKGNCKENKQK